MLPPNVAIVNGSGSFNITLKTAGNDTITATDVNNSVLTGTSSPIVVSPAAASQLVVTTQPSMTVLAGVTFVQQPVVAEEDPFGNRITSDSTHTVTVARGSQGTATFRAAR